MWPGIPHHRGLLPADHCGHSTRSPGALSPEHLTHGKGLGFIQKSNHQAYHLNNNLIRTMKLTTWILFIFYTHTSINLIHCISFYLSKAIQFKKNGYMYMLHEYKGRNIWANLKCWGKIAMKDLDKNKNKAWGKKYCMYSTLLIVEECMHKICSWGCLWIP